MKRTIIFSAFMVMLLLAVSTSAQNPDLRLAFSYYIAQNGMETGSITYTGLEAPGVQVFEAVIPAATEAACFASRDFSMARPVGPDRASVVFDHATSSYQLRWTRVRERGDSCRVLLVGQTIGSSDLADWQSNYGAGGFSENALTKEQVDELRGDGSVRPIRHSISLTPAGSSSGLSVRYPNQDGEVVEVGFPAAANSNFRLLETRFPARTDAECVANEDFSAAVPVGIDRGTIGYFPSTGLWNVRNTYTGATTVECHALLVDGDSTVDAADYVLWRSSFGSTAFADGDELRKDAGHIDEAARQSVPGNTVTYTYEVRNTSSPGILLR